MTHPAPLRFPQPHLARDPRQLKRERALPDLPVVDDTGRRLRFYSDVVRDQRVLLHVIYSACQLYCPPATHNLMQARELLGPEAERLRIVSITLTPVSDDPVALAAHRQRYRLPANWWLLTGQPRHIEPLCRALGFLPARGDQPLDYHATSGLIGDEAAVKWSHVSMLQPPRGIARMIRFGLA